jgi:hypothetical protein
VQILLGEKKRYTTINEKDSTPNGPGGEAVLKSLREGFFMWVREIPHPPKIIQKTSFV